VSPKRTLIFDFDGTLADTLPHLLALSNRLASEYGYRQVVEEDIEALRGLHAREVIRWLGVPWYKLPRLARRFRAELHHEMPLVAPVESMPAAIAQLAPDFGMGIVTTNSVDNVRSFLTTHRMPHFAFVCSSPRLLGKQRTLKWVLREQRLLSADTLYIGDEVRDVEAARACGLDALAVSWGANDAYTLKRASPYAMVHDPGDLPEVVDAWAAARRATLG
jgi:phosphoglycolate phosphatase-like HAD superfamily hydrolase